MVLWCEQIPSRVSWHSVRQTQEPTNRLGCQQGLVPRFCSVPSQALTGDWTSLPTVDWCRRCRVAHLSRMVETDPLCAAARRAAVHVSVSVAGPPGGGSTFSYTISSFGSRAWEILLQKQKHQARLEVTTLPKSTGQVSNNTFPITHLAPSSDLPRELGRKRHHHGYLRGFLIATSSRTQLPLPPASPDYPTTRTQRRSIHPHRIIDIAHFASSHGRTKRWSGFSRQASSLFSRRSNHINIQAARRRCYWRHPV